MQQLQQTITSNTPAQEVKVGKEIMANKSLKQRLMSIEASTCFEFRQIREDAVELLIDREGYAGEYSIAHARRVCRELGHDWQSVFRKW